MLLISVRLYVDHVYSTGIIIYLFQSNIIIAVVVLCCACTDFITFRKANLKKKKSLIN